MSNLVKHAEREMRKAGLYDTDSGYGGMLPEAVMALVKAHSEQGHSGGSHSLTLQVFNRVVNFKTLTPVTSDPDEWMEVGTNVWQNNRQSTVFSQDGGKTWYDIEDPKKKNWPKHSLRKRLYWKWKHFSEAITPRRKSANQLMTVAADQADQKEGINEVPKTQ